MAEFENVLAALEFGAQASGGRGVEAFMGTQPEVALHVIAYRAFEGDHHKAAKWLLNLVISSLNNEGLADFSYLPIDGSIDLPQRSLSL